MNTEFRLFERKNDAFDCALLAANEYSYLPYDGMDIYAEGSNCVKLFSDNNAESSLIKKDLLNSLSPDAHFIIDAIKNELPALATPKTGNITKSSIERFLMKKHWSKRKIHKSFIEIQGFVMEISSL
jgi:hypothetical protein